MTTAHSRRLRILYLSWRDGDHPESGGAETYVERTSQVLVERGHDVTIFSAAFPGASRTASRGSVRIVRAGGRFTCYTRGMQFLRKNRERFDVVIDIQNGVPFWSPLVTDLPVVTLLHHLHKDQWPIIFGPRAGRVGWWVESKVAPIVYRKAQYVTVSQSTRDDLGELGIPSDRVAITYSGNDHPPDLESYASQPRCETPSLLVLGRLVPHKHVEKAIDLVRTLAPAHPGLHLHIVGHGYWEDELRRYAAEHGVGDAVRFHGFVSDEEKRQLLSSAWVVVMPSQKEGWGLTIVEAGLHGAPCVAFDYAGGVTESLIHGETGFLVRDDAEMTTQVDGLLADQPLRDKLGVVARRHAASFTWEATGIALESVLLDAAERGRPVN